MLSVTTEDDSPVTADHRHGSVVVHKLRRERDQEWAHV